MRKSLRHIYPLQLALFSGVVATSTTVALLSPGLSGSGRAALQDDPKTVVDEVWQIVNREYVDTTFNKVDWQSVRQTLLDKNYTSRQQAYQAITVALKQLNDPYTRFMDAEAYKELTTQTTGELSGIGVRLEVNKQTQNLTVVEPIANSPAFRGGLKAGDQILAIDSKPTRNMSIEAASNLIRGETGTPITLRVARQGISEFNLRLVRARIEVPTVRYAVRQEGKDRIGYLRLQEFNAHAASQMRQSINDLKSQQVNAFVLDLRGNPGGLLQSSIEIARMWLDKGSIVRTVGRQGNATESTASQSALTQLPLVILVDRSSASASEILAGALKDNRRATVVGNPTFGKALVQSVQSLSDGSGLAVTVAHYYTPNGTDISRKGIAPHIQVSLTSQQRQALAANPALLGTQADPQYTKAVGSLKAILAQPKQSTNRAATIVPLSRPR